LAETKSIILLTDVDGADALILPLFTICFDIVSGSFKGSTGGEIERAVEYNMTNLLVVVIDEVAVLPQEVVDVILSQFLRVDPRSTQHASGKGKKNGEVQDDKQGNLLLKDYPAAYNMAKAICTTCPEKMTSQISQYFNNVIVDASASRETSGHPKHGARRISNLDESDDEAEDVKELSKAHQLIRELWRACPDVLQNVVPQLEAELSAESVSLRLLATETLGDVAAGIGVSGPPPPAQMDAAAYPPTSMLHADQPFSGLNRLLVPMSPKPFFSTHAAAYSSFLSRRLDRSPSVRAAWATAVGRILLTSAGGIGFDDGEDTKLLAGLAQTLGDADEKVRLAAIKVIASFSFVDVITRFGPNGGIEKQGSVMCALAERIKDRKHAIREQAAKVLGRLWGVASNDIQESTERVVSTLGQIPIRILDSVYTGEPDIQVLVDRVTFELLLPVTFPPIKARSKQEKPQGKEKESGLQDDDATDPNLIRVQRILTLVKNLDDRAKMVFFMMQNRQVGFGKLMAAYLKACEDYNGGIVDGDEEPVKSQLTKIVDAISKTLPDSSRVSADLWKFAKMHDRRNYQLIRYAMSPENDYRTVTNAMKELTKRIRDGPSATVSLLDTYTPILYRCSLLVYNRSHVPAIMKMSRTDDYSLGETAYEMLKEISTRNPEVLGTHVQEMCKDLEINAPTADKAEQSSAADTLKACAAFARKFPAEISKDRKFLLAITNYALYARMPQAAKHAVSIIMTAADKKEMYAKDLVRKATKDCIYTSPHFLTRLATISQICLLAPAAANSESDAIVKVALDDTLLSNRAPSAKAEAYSWSNMPDDETLAKEWALKILVNRCRSEEDNLDSVPLREVVNPLYTILTKLIVDEGELLPSKDTPPRQKSRLRLTAARLLLKLCSHLHACEALVRPAMFNATALVALDRLLPVRTGFVNQIKKYLSQKRLHQRWYTVLFLLAYEPDTDLQSSTVTWLKSRAQAFVRNQQQQAQSSIKSSHDNVMELLFARLLSLLAHHPDFPERGTEDYHPDLVDYSKYICFYLSTIANEDNLSLVFHIAQRVKQTKDAVAEDAKETNDHLYILSDLAQATIRNYADVLSHQKGHAANVNILQTWPGKLRLPSALFAALPNHTVAQEIADKNFLPEEVANDLERFVKAYMKPSKGGAGHNLKATEKKRKSDSKDYDINEDENPAKRAKKTAALPVRKASTGAKTPKPQKKRKSDEVPSSELPSRKSTRTSHAAAVSYADRDSDEDDAEMLEVEETSSKRSRTKVGRSISGTEKADKAKVDPKQLDEEEKENEVRNPDDEVDENTDVDEMDVESSSREASPSPLRAKTNGVTKKGKKGTLPKTTGTSSRAVSGNVNGHAVVRKSPSAKKKVTPLKKTHEPVTNARETRRTRAAA
jgi:sister-chromatid-cohesion protein PDS5